MVLGDLHVCPGFPATSLAPALELALAEKPDLVFLVGDYICDREGDPERDMAACVAALEPLARSTPLGAFAAFGNHDFPRPPFDPKTGLWQAAGITPLLDSSAPVRRGKDLLTVVGLRSAVSRPTDPARVLAASGEGVRLLLWHEPDGAVRAAAAGASLMLSGHTHGGQLVLPGVGPLQRPKEGQRYPSGLVFVEGMPLYTTRGVGVLPPRIRLNCPPEVTVLTLTSRPVLTSSSRA